MFHFIFKHIELPLHVVFSTFSPVFGNVIKHGLSSLICYLSHSQAQEESNNLQHILMNVEVFGKLMKHSWLDFSSDVAVESKSKLTIQLRNEMIVKATG